MSVQRGPRACYLACFFVALWQECAGQKLIVHVQTLEKPCLMRIESAKSNNTQFEICRDWTNGREITEWNMTPWTEITSSKHAILNTYSMQLKFKTTTAADGKTVVTNPAYYTEISYQTSVKVPYILRKITGMHPSMHVRKHIFLHGNNLYSNIQIEKIPILSFITIKNKMNIFKSDYSPAISRHYITHGDIPFFLKWSKSILKEEITKSLDRYDEISIASFCKKQSV